MSEYTPTTEQVRLAAGGAWGTAEFDRWLASVQAEAWDKGFKYAAFAEGYLDELEEENPYREESK